MAELLAICQAAAAARTSGTQLFMATVVRVAGSSYRRPGARMLFTVDRLLAGSISGGCLERDVLSRGPYLTRERPAAVVRYDSASEDELFSRTGLGCGGVVDVLIERVDLTASSDAVAFFESCLAAQCAGVLVTVHESSVPELPLGARLALSGREQRASFGDVRLQRELGAVAEQVRERAQSRSYCAPDGSLVAFVEYFAPPPHLFVCGSNHDVAPLLALARTLDWQVTSVDHRERFGPRETLSRLAPRLIVSADALTSHVDRYARPLVVIMSHDYDYDRSLLRALLPSRALYLGLLGPKRRATRMLDELAQRGCVASRGQLARLFAPAGLALGADGPAEIAVSIVAEVQALLARATAISLRETYPPDAASERDFAASAE